MNRIHVQRNILVIAVAFAAAACGGTGPQGPQGPAGPPADRSKLYCRDSAAILNASNLTTTITCDAKTDIPWEGSCSATELPSGMYLSISEAVNWSDLNALPGWTCTWAAFQAVPNQNFGANAQICCFAIGR
jgi:hypothetical protein